MNKIRILHLLQSDKFSGAENMVCQIINMFKDNDNIEMVYCSPDGQIRNALENRNIKFYPIKKFSFSEVKRVVNKFEPHIIHAHDISSSVIASIYSKDISVISHIHGNHENMRKINLKSVLYLISSLGLTKILWVSKSAKKNYQFSSLIKNKSVVLQNILDISEISKRVKEDSTNYNFDIIFLGRLTYPKNPKRLIDVLKLVYLKIPNIKVAIVGDGDLLEQTEKYSNQLGIRQNIHFFGFQSNPMKILNDSKLMVMTSIFEGTPMCILESMTLGVPVVSTPTDGIVDVISEGKTGYLSEENDGLADKIVFLLQNDDIRSQMSRENVLYSKEFNDINKYKSYLLEIYLSSEFINELEV